MEKVDVDIHKFVAFEVVFLVIVDLIIAIVVFVFSFVVEEDICLIWDEVELEMPMLIKE